MTAQPVRRFVRSAWTLLTFQLLAAIAAVGVTAWAAFQVQPMLVQREELRADIGKLDQEKSKLEKQKAELEAQQAQLVKDNDDLASRLTRSRQEARVQAAPSIRQAINAYQAGKYSEAIATYDQALALDPKNAYVLDLRSYSQFKANDLQGAIASVTEALVVDPGYVYGYSELIRYACAAQQFDLAVSTYAKAKGQYAQVQGLVANLLQTDGEFSRLCSNARPQLQ